MANLVCDHIGFRELAVLAANVASAKAPLQILKECGVQINLLVDRAVKRPHSGLGNATSRASSAREHNQRRSLVGLPSLREDILPLDFRAAKNGRYELPHLVGRRARFGLTWNGLGLLL